jgi:hypothetical protein
VVPVSQNVLNVKINATNGTCPTTVVIIRPINATTTLNTTMVQFIKNCNGKFTQPSVKGKLQYGKKYRYVTKAFGYYTATGNFTYNTNPQDLTINLRKRTM